MRRDPVEDRSNAAPKRGDAIHLSKTLRLFFHV